METSLRFHTLTALPSRNKTPVPNEHAAEYGQQAVRTLYNPNVYLLLR